ncbi:zinc finger protein 420-like [Trichoplusia ni]|uniref:Zinc finger protein 420-like n=1 Tax=Trichoplusia ni TaxID=7111 RepID=A0A7E5VN74_TRINI|nr:zinc finger protein 420-like [Trichoplusia ni]
MYILKACAVCFSTDVKLYSLNLGQLRQEFHLISGIQTSCGDGLPDYLCYQCTALVRSFKRFRDKCHRARYALKELLSIKKQINASDLNNVNRSLLGISPTLSYMSLDKTHCEQAKFQWKKLNHIDWWSKSKGDPCPVAHCSTLTSDDTFNIQPPLPVEIEFTENNIKTDKEEPINEELDISYEPSKDETVDSQMTENTDVDNSFVDNDNYESDNQVLNEYSNAMCKVEATADGAEGSKNDEEYATMIAISLKEAKAAIEVYKMFSLGKFRCEICHKAYYNENRLKIHLRMHDKHVSGSYRCTLCEYYYKTEFLLKTHMTEKHMFKYLCKKCPEVSFDRTSAKQHYIWTHLQKGSKKDANWYESRPSWLSKTGGKRIKGVVTLRPVKKMKKVPEDFLIYSPIAHEEQYTLVQERQKSRNYQEAKYKCHLCYRGFRVMSTYTKHMKKHDPEQSGYLQCDMCKLQFTDHRKMYKHMNITHLYKYSCQMCSFVCYNRGQAQMHYRWHKNVTYSCPHCNKEFMKASTRLTHIRVKHPSMNLCNLCGHSFVSDTGLYCHKQIAHTKEEIELSSKVVANPADPSYCADCNIQFVSAAAYDTHLGSSYKHATTNVSSKPSRAGRERAEAGRGARGRPRRGVCSEIVNNGVTTSTTCEVCGKFLANDVQARKHYESEHPDTEFLKRYMCDVCGHTTRQYANLIVHMRTHTNEKPYGCPHCDRRFNMPSNRDRHLVVHTGEKRYQCQHCSRRFTQSSAVKLHIQTVHLKIPYAPWNKKNRKRRKELESAGMSTPLTLPPVPHKLTAYETPGDYLNAYITYNDE